MVERRDRFDREHVGDRCVLDHRKAVAIRLLAARCEIGRTGKSCRIGAVEIDNYELVMDVHAPTAVNW
jgi:hypothetical protein